MNATLDKLLMPAEPLFNRIRTCFVISQQFMSGGDEFGVCIVIQYTARFSTVSIFFLG